MKPEAGLAYRPELDALRAVAVGLVLFSHFWFNDSGLGHVGVRLFFVLSGFLITTILLEGGSAAGFYVRRIFRLAPALYLALALALLLDLDGMRATWKWHFLQITNILLARLDSWSPIWPADHLWTLNVEEQFYLVWPLVIGLTPRRLLPTAFAVLIVMAPAFRIAGHVLGWGEVATLVLPPASFDALGFGGLMAVLNLRLGRWTLLCSPGLLAVAINPFPSSFWLKEFAELASLPVLGALVRAGWDGRLGLRHRPLVAIGRISYGVYLYHGFVFGLVALWGLSERGPLLMIVATVITFVVAALSYATVERPVRAMGRRIATRLETLKGANAVRPPEDGDAGLV